MRQCDWVRGGGTAAVTTKESLAGRACVAVTLAAQLLSQSVDAVDAAAAAVVVDQAEACADEDIKQLVVTSRTRHKSNRWLHLNSYCIFAQDKTIF